MFKQLRVNLFSGSRLGRIEFIGLNSFLWLTIFMLAILADIVLPKALDWPIMVGFILLMIFTIVLKVRRLNDIGLSGWCVIPALFLNFIASILLAIIPGNKAENKYGLPPQKASAFYYYCIIAFPIICFIVFYFGMIGPEKAT